MSIANLSRLDVGQLRQLGTLVDAILIGPKGAADPQIKAACEELARILDDAMRQPPQNLRSLVFSELLGQHLRLSGDATRSLLHDLRSHVVAERTVQQLETLAQLIERDRALAADRLQQLP